MVVIAVVVPITMTTRPRCFHITPTALCLPAVLTVLALGIVQFAFRIADTLFAFAVVITVKRLYGNCTAEKRENDQRRKHRFHFVQHGTSR
jgi:CBS-domain-containing membrane protein